jgi:hypothetical protein
MTPRQDMLIAVVFALLIGFMIVVLIGALP